MRVKTDAQRDAILAAASEVFKEWGYKGAAMAQVAARLGGSKATLYRYFTSKEELFAAAMVNMVEQSAFDAFFLLEAPPGQALAEVLERFGVAYLRFNLGDPMLEITRLAISEGRDTSLGARLYSLGVQEGWKRVAEFFASRLDPEALPIGGSAAVASQYRALLIGDALERRLRSVVSSIDDAELQLIARQAAGLVVRAYAAKTPG